MSYDYYRIVINLVCNNRDRQYIKYLISHITVIYVNHILKIGDFCVTTYVRTWLIFVGSFTYSKVVVM